MKVRNFNIAPWCDTRGLREKTRKTSNSLRDYLELTFGILSIKLFASESIRATRKWRVWNVSVNIEVAAAAAVEQERIYKQS